MLSTVDFSAWIGLFGTDHFEIRLVAKNALEHPFARRFLDTDGLGECRVRTPFATLFDELRADDMKVTFCDPALPNHLAGCETLLEG